MRDGCVLRKRLRRAWMHAQGEYSVHVSEEIPRRIETDTSEYSGVSSRDTHLG